MKKIILTCKTKKRGRNVAVNVEEKDKNKKMPNDNTRNETDINGVGSMTETGMER